MKDSPSGKSLHRCGKGQTILHIRAAFFQIAVAAVDHIDKPDFEDECQCIDDH